MLFFFVVEVVWFKKKCKANWKWHKNFLRGSSFIFVHSATSRMWHEKRRGLCFETQIYICMCALMADNLIVRHFGCIAVSNIFLFQNVTLFGKNIIIFFTFYNDNPLKFTKKNMPFPFAWILSSNIILEWNHCFSNVILKHMSQKNRQSKSYAN